jgi:hypothetical protein
MKHLLTCTIVFLVHAFSCTTTAIAFSETLKLSNLPDGTRLSVPHDIRLEYANDEHDLIYRTHFDNGSMTLSKDIDSWGYSLDSGVTIRAFWSDAVIAQFESDWLFEFERILLLQKNIFCLSKKESRFGANQVRLLLRDCNTQEAAFHLYVNAGYSLRNSSGFRGITIRDFNDQVDHQLIWQK